MKRGMLAIWLLAGILACEPLASALQLQAEGQLKPPPDAKLVAVSTDFAIQKILGDSIWDAKRNPPEGATNIGVLTVTYDEHLMAPGVSLEDIARGDNELLAMLKHTGVAPTPMEPSESIVPRDRHAALAMQFHSRLQTGKTIPHPGTDQDYAPAISPSAADADIGGTDSIPNTSYGATAPPPAYIAGAPPEQSYNKVIVLRATLSDAPGKFTVVALVRAGQDLAPVKKRLAAEIAREVLR